MSKQLKKITQGGGRTWKRKGQPGGNIDIVNESLRQRTSKKGKKNLPCQVIGRRARANAAKEKGRSFYCRAKRRGTTGEEVGSRKKGSRTAPGWPSVEKERNLGTRVQRISKKKGKENATDGIYDKENSVK